MRVERDQAFWEALAARRWRRVKWRRSDAAPAELPDGERCAAFDTPIHRRGTYYLRPAYTDGEVWLCQRAYEEMLRRTGRPPSRQYSRRPEDREPPS
ncbi:MAG: hypothetical protein R3362_00850 [Rhodothermales bacterium]|nr:hypothetical protein [Rhodothermales bacterium]